MAKVLVGIPTRERPACLAMLLTTLLFQDMEDFDILVVDSDPEGEGKALVGLDPLVYRLSVTLRALGHRVMFQWIPVNGRSEVSAVNLILTTAVEDGYEFVYKIDDDHVLPPDALGKLLDAYKQATAEVDGSVLVSGVTPWMHKAWEDAAGPEDPVLDASDDEGALVTDIFLQEDGTHHIDIGHFSRYSSREIRRTKLASAANFFMRPDARILWSDIGQSSLFADAIWFLQLQKFLGYALFFDLSVDAWHVAAPSGGVREKEDVLDKVSSFDNARRTQLNTLLRELGMEGPGL